MSEKGQTVTEVIHSLKPYKRTVWNAHDTKDDVFRLGQIEGRNQVLYLLLALGDENVAHDNWHPDRASILVEARKVIVKRLKHPFMWPRDWPDFEIYLCRPG